MSPRLVTIAKALLYPLFYLVCLGLGLVLSFPWDQVKHRIEAEFAKTQAGKGPNAWRLEIGELDGYWLTGVEVRSAKLIIPPDEDSTPKSSAGGASSKASIGADDEGGDDGGEDVDGEGADGAEAKKRVVGPLETTILLEEGHARVRLLPLLIGRVRVDFELSVLGGEVSGTVPVGGGDFDVELDSVDLGQLVPLKDLVTLPVQGVASGRLTLSAADGKFSKASGAMDLTVKDVVLGDGKAKLAGKMALPPALLGTLEVSAKAENGVLTLEKLDAQGKDGEIHGAGTVKLRQPWDMSVADIYLRFGFSDEYRSTNDKTKALLGEPGQDFPPPLIDQDRKMKRAKRSDGLYGFRIHGRLRALKFDPTTADGPKPSSKTPASAGADPDDDGDDKATSPQFGTKRKVRKPSSGTPKSPATSVERKPSSIPEPPSVREPTTPRIPEPPGVPEVTRPAPAPEPEPAQPEPPQPEPSPEPPPPESEPVPGAEEAPAPGEEAPAPQ